MLVAPIANKSVVPSEEFFQQAVTRIRLRSQNQVGAPFLTGEIVFS